MFLPGTASCLQGLLDRLAGLCDTIVFPAALRSYLRGGRPRSNREGLVNLAPSDRTNRFYYQWTIPKKDALILAKADDPEFRRAWITRVTDHDGIGDSEGGIRKWYKLSEAAGLNTDDVASLRYVLPGARFAVGLLLTLPVWAAGTYHLKRRCCFGSKLTRKSADTESPYTDPYVR